MFDLNNLNGYEIVTADLTRDEIAADCRIMVIYNPMYDFVGAEVEDEAKNEIEKIDKFLDNYDCDIYVYTKGSEGSVAGTITGVEISNNFFWSNENEPGYSGWWYGNGAKICYKSAGDSKITNNFFYYFNERSKILDIRLSENITVSDNYAKGTVTDDNFKFVAVKESNTTNIVQNNNVLDIIERE